MQPAGGVVAPSPAAVPVARQSVAEPEAAVGRTAVSEVPPGNNGDEEPPGWPDENAELAYLAEARERGEPVAVAPRQVTEDDLSDPQSLPPLEELVQRIPAGVREMLDDLFRAKFTKVRKIPRAALKE